MAFELFSRSDINMPQLKQHMTLKDKSLQECQIERSLSEFPNFVKEIISPQLTRKFADIINNYNYKFRYIPHIFWDRESWNSLCCAMFRSVLTPHVYGYNYEIVLDSFTQDLVVLTLDCVRGLKTLHLPHTFALARMIYHLRYLQIFTCRTFCTDEVIEQLGLHCTHLKIVSLCCPLSVTNDSAKHLLRLRKLEF
jgi:hypothetical protein